MHSLKPHVAAQKPKSRGTNELRTAGKISLSRQHESPQQQADNISDTVQRSALSLTSCPSCNGISILSSSQANPAHLLCKQCGVLEDKHQKIARNQQIAIIKNAVHTKHDCSHSTPEADTETDKTPTMTQPSAHAAEYMSDTPDTEPRQGGTGNTSQAALGDEGVGAKSEKSDEDIRDYIEDDSDQEAEEENGTIAWFTETLAKMEDTWAQKLQGLNTTIQEEAAKSRTDIQNVKKAMHQEATNNKNFAQETKKSMTNLLSNQHKIMETQKSHSVALESVQLQAIQDIEKKLSTTLEHSKQLHEEVQKEKANHQPGTNTYAQKAALQPPQPPAPEKPIPKYISMSKRIEKPRPQATQTDGALERVYIKDWRSEPVGVVKKALRQDIGEWAAQRALEHGAMDTVEAMPDIDAVRHRR